MMRFIWTAIIIFFSLAVLAGMVLLYMSSQLFILSFFMLCLYSA